MSGLVHFGSPEGSTYDDAPEPAPKPFIHFGSPEAQS